MPGNADQIVVAGTGTIFIAPYGTALPANPPTTAVRETLDAAFIDFGYTNEDGVTLTDGVETNEVNAWQSQYPVRMLVAGYSGTIAFTLLQWSKDIFEQVLHGVVTEPVADTVHLFTPTRDGVVPEKSLVIDFDDGTVTSGPCLVATHKVRGGWPPTIRTSPSTDGRHHSCTDGTRGTPHTGLRRGSFQAAPHHAGGGAGGHHHRRPARLLQSPVGRPVATVRHVA